MPLVGARQAMAQQRLVAQLGRLFSGNGLRGRNAPFDPWELLLLCAGLAALAFLAWLLKSYLAMRAEARRKCPRRLFRELCRAHGIGWSDRRLLVELARWHGLPLAAELFVASERFDPEKAGGPLARRRERLAALQQRLFQGGLRSWNASEALPGPAS